MPRYIDLICDLFKAANGRVTVSDTNGETFSDDDLHKVGAWASNATDPWLDLVTENGEAVGIFVAGNPAAAEPKPSLDVHGGMIYLIDGDPVPGQKAGLHLVPLDRFLDKKTGAGSTDGLTWHAAEVDILTPGSLAPISLMMGRSRQEAQGKWKPISSTFSKFSDTLRDHKAGLKDGSCYLQGESVDGARKSSAQIANYILAVDLDSGAPLHDVIDTITKHGLEAAIYTTHSHLKDTTEIKRDHFMKKMDASDASQIDLLRQYLIQWKGVLPSLVKTLKVLDDAMPTADGVVIVVRHNPIPKFRAVFPLSDKFEFARRGGSHQDAINEWKERYAGFCTDMGFFFDEKCVDPARLFYLPRHKKGDNTFGAWRIVGATLDLDKFSRVKTNRKRRPGAPAGPANAFTNAVGDAGHYDDGDDADRYITCDGFDLRRWSAKHAKRFEIETMLDQVVGGDFIREPRQSGKAGVHVECPFEAEHSSFGGNGTFVVNAGDNFAEGFEGGFAFNCQHHACAGRDRLDFLKELLDNEVISTADLIRQGFLLELELEEENVAVTEDRAPDRAETASLEEGDLEEAMTAMNRDYAVLRDKKSVTIVVLEDLKIGVISDLSVHAFKTLEENNNVLLLDGNGKSKLVNVAVAWLKWERRREYSGLGFYPGNDGPAKHLNTFAGLPIKPKPGTWQILQEHMLVNLCEGDSTLYEHLLTWLAEIVQRPSKKTGSALVLLGEKGTGKSVFADAFGTLLGRYAITVAQPRAIYGNFNAHLKSKLLVVAEEAAIAAAAGADGIIKDLITGNSIHIEGKGRESFEETNNIRLMLISNDAHVVRASIGTERRFFVLRCGERNRGDHEYFNGLLDELRNGGYEAMLHDLMSHVPIHGWDSLRRPPNTAHLLAQQIETLTPTQEFMRNWLRDGLVETDHGEPRLVLNHHSSTQFKAIEIRNAILEHLSLNLYGSKSIASPDAVARECERWLGGQEIKIRHDGERYTRRTIVIPKLADARAHAAAKFGIQFDDDVNVLTDTPDNVVPLRASRLSPRSNRSVH